MIRKIIADFLIIFLSISLLYTKYIDISIYGSRPDLILIFIVFIGIFEGGFHPIFLGFFGGLAFDLAGGGGTLGLNAFVYTFIGYISVFPRKIFQVNSVIIAPISLFFAVIAKTLIFITIYSIFVGSLPILDYIKNIATGEFLYTLTLSIPVYLILREIYKFMDKLKKYV